MVRDEPDHPDRNRRKLYGRRKGPKLSGRQAGLRRTLLAELAYVRAKIRWRSFRTLFKRSGWKSVSGRASIWSGRPSQNPDMA